MFDDRGSNDNVCGRKFQLLLKRLDQRNSLIRNLNFWNIRRNFKFSRYTWVILIGTTILNVDMISCFLFPQSKPESSLQSETVISLKSQQVPIFVSSAIVFGWLTASYFSRLFFLKIMLPLASLTPMAVVISQVSYLNESLQEFFFGVSILLSSVFYAIFPIVMLTALEQIRIPENVVTVRPFLFCLLQSWRMSYFLTDYNMKLEPSNLAIYRFVFIFLNMLVLTVLSFLSKDVIYERTHVAILEKCAFFSLKRLIGTRQRRSSLHGRQTSSEHSAVKDATKRMRYVIIIFILQAVFSIMWRIIYAMTVHQANLLDISMDSGNTVRSILFFIGVTVSEFVLLPVFKFAGFNSEQKTIYLGHCLLFLSAICSIFFQSRLQNRLDNFPKEDNAFLRLYNGLNSTVFLVDDRQTASAILPHDLSTIRNIVGNESPVRRNFRFEGMEINRAMTLSATLGECSSVVISEDGVGQLLFNDPVTTKVMTHDSWAQVFLVSALKEGIKGVVSFFCESGKNYTVVYKKKHDFVGFLLDDERCEISFTANKLNFNISRRAVFRKGGIYSVFLLADKDKGVSGKVFNLVEPFDISAYWLAPQMICLVAGYSVTEISWITIFFLESPPMLRSFLFSMWGLVHLTEIPFFPPDFNYLILVVALDVFNSLIFTVLSYKYRYIPVFQFRLSILS